MAIAAQWVVTSPYSTTTALYTTPTAAFAATAGTYLYQRDLVITNNGASTMFVSLGTGATGAITTSSFALPTGGSVILTQCQVPNASIIFGVGQGGAAGSASIGWATNVAYIWAMGFSLQNASIPVTVGTAATTLYTAPTTGLYYRDLVISNAGPGTIYLGGSTMATTATQYLALPVNESILLGGQVESVYAITASGTATAYVGNASVVSVA